MSLETKPSKLRKVVAAKPASSLDKLKRRIFVAGNHPAFCESLVPLINGENDLTVCGKAGCDKNAFRDIRRLRPDLAVIDLELSEKIGVDLIKQVRSLKLPVKLLVLSLHDKALLAQRVLRAGGDGYILKQEDPPEIINAIRDVLNGRIYVSEEVLASRSSKAPSVSKTSSLDKLKDSELAILKSLGEGNSNEEIGQQFLMTASEVNAQCIQIQHKLELRSINALIRYAVCWVEGITR